MARYCGVVVLSILLMAATTVLAGACSTQGGASAEVGKIELVSPEFINHEAPPGRDRGPDSMRGLATMLRTAFTDLHFEIEELVAEGDTVAGRLRMSGTHEGPLMGTPPTGRSVRQEHMHFVRFEGGKGVEHWGVRDDLGMMQQLGLMPDPGQPGETDPT